MMPLYFLYNGHRLVRIATSKRREETDASCELDLLSHGDIGNADVLGCSIIAQLSVG